MSSTTRWRKTPDAVEKFIGALVPPTAAKAADEAKQIQAMIDKSGKHFDLKPWDWEMYSEKVRKAKYDLDQNELKPYFELNKVLQDGVFYAANQLYGITFKERHDIPVYQPDVRVFDVFDKDGSQLGMIYFDYFKRDNKAGGAWMSNWVQAVAPARHQAGRLQRREFHQARSRPARADQLRRRDDDVPRIRPRAARPVRATATIRRLPAPTRRATGWNSRRSSTSIGRSIPTCSSTMR